MAGTDIWHGRKQSSHHDRMAISLTYDHVGTNPKIISKRNAQHSHLTMWEHLPQPCQKGLALTSVNQCQKGFSTYTRPWEEPILHVEKALHLHLKTNVIKDQHLYSTMQGTNPSCWKGSALTSDNQCQKGLALIFIHARNESFMLKGLCTCI